MTFSASIDSVSAERLLQVISQLHPPTQILAISDKAGQVLAANAAAKSAFNLPNELIGETNLHDFLHGQLQNGTPQKDQLTGTIAIDKNTQYTYNAQHVDFEGHGFMVLNVSPASAVVPSENN